MSVSLEAPVGTTTQPAIEEYRALSPMAVASLVMALASPLIFAGPALTFIPALGLLLGLRSWVTIRRDEDLLTGLPLAKAGTFLSLAFIVLGWSWFGYVYATEVPEGYQRVSYATLQPHPNDTGQVVPPEALALDGKRIFIKGYVYPGQQKSGIQEFVLCRDNGDCCFGGSPKLTDMILVRLQEPLRMTYESRMWRVAGTFRVNQTQGTDGLGDVVYQLEADYLK